MMRPVALSSVYQLIEPGPVVFLTTAHRGRSNVMTMSWHMMVEFEPPLIACVVSEDNHSFAALRATKECVIAVPPATLAKKVVGVGNTHGGAKPGPDKLKKFGLTPLQASVVAPPLIVQCFANLECRVVDTRMVKRYDLFILEVVRAWIDRRFTLHRHPSTLHHRGYGTFAVDGRTIRLRSRMK